MAPASMTDGQVLESASAAKLDGYAGDPDFMASLARGLAVIRAFSGGSGGRTIGALAQATGLSRAAVRRCLYTLEQLGYAAADDAGRYSLRPQILALGYAFLSSSSVVANALPVLDAVSAAVHESCSMAVLEGESIVYIARSPTSQRLMSVDLGVGSRLPAYCTSMGRVLLAGLPRGELDRFLSRIVPVAHTSRTLTRRDQLRRVVADAARDGFALVDEELEIGLRSVAVPVRARNGDVVAALNVSTHASRASVDELRVRCLPPLLNAANELAIGWPG